VTSVLSRPAFSSFNYTSYVLWPVPIQNYVLKLWVTSTICRTPWTGDQPDARPLPKQDSTTQKDKDKRSCRKRESNHRSQRLSDQGLRLSGTNTLFIMWTNVSSDKRTFSTPQKFDLNVMWSNCCTGSVGYDNYNLVKVQCRFTKKLTPGITRWSHCSKWNTLLYRFYDAVSPLKPSRSHVTTDGKSVLVLTRL
jgi:hypothetical protein